MNNFWKWARRKVLSFTDLMTSEMHGVIFPMENSVLTFIQPTRHYQPKSNNGMKYLKSVFSSIYYLFIYLKK